MTAADRIKQAMASKGIKGAELARRIGATKGAVSQWVNGLVSPSGENLVKIANLLEVSPAWLLTGSDGQIAYIDSEKQKGLVSVQSNAVIIGTISEWDSDTPLEEDEVELPFYTEVALAAGNGSLLTRENHGPKLRFSISTLRRHGVQPDKAICVNVTGNSMEPILPDGCTVGIDTAQTDIRDGKMYAVRQGDMVRIKMVYRLPGGGLRLRSFNSDEHQDENYTAADRAEIHIIGRMFWSSVLW